MTIFVYNTAGAAIAGGGAGGRGGAITGEAGGGGGGGGCAAAGAVGTTAFGVGGGPGTSAITVANPSMAGAGGPITNITTHNGYFGGGGGGATAADVWSYATRRLSTTGISDITTGLATEANATTNTSSIVTILNALNDIAPSDVLTQVTSALNSYDPPTKAELDTAQASIESDIAGISTPSMLDTGTGSVIIPLD